MLWTLQIVEELDFESHARRPFAAIKNLGQSHNKNVIPFGNEKDTKSETPSEKG